MKRTYLLLSLLLFISHSLWAKDRVIKNPQYKVNNSGIREVVKIVLTDKTTELHLKTPNTANSLISSSTPIYIEVPETDLKLPLQSIVSPKLLKNTPDSEVTDSIFILQFPSLPKGTEYINFLEGSDIAIYDISLTQKSKSISKSVLPKPVKKWIMDELARAERKELIEVSCSSEFFSDEKSRIIGYMKGYDARLGFTTGLLLENSTVELNQLSHLIKIHSDGRFEVEFTPHHPSYNLFININDFYYPYLYIEPGQTLAVVIDWEEMRAAMRTSSRGNMKHKEIEFFGPLAEINQALFQFETKISPLYSLDDDTNVYKNLDHGNELLMEPLELSCYFKEKLKEVAAKQSEAINQMNPPLRAKQLMDQSLKLERANDLLRYLHRYITDDPNYEVSESYYSFLKEFPQDDFSYLSANEYDRFVNFLQFSSIPFDARNAAAIEAQMPLLSFEDYLFNELHLTPSPLDLEYLELIKPYTDGKGLLNLATLDDTLPNEKAVKEKIIDELILFYERYKEYEEEYRENCSSEFTAFKEFLVTVKSYEYSLNKLMPTDANLITGFISLHCYNSIFEELTIDESLQCIEFIREKLPFSYIEQLLNTIHKTLFETVVLPSKDPLAMKAFTDILESFRGKYVLVDVWSTWCGPCLASIASTKGIREAYENHPDFAFVFISNEKLNAKYLSFAQNNRMIYNYILDKDEYNHFCSQFKIASLPRYLLFDKKGELINDNFDIQMLGDTLKELDISPNE